MKTIGSWYDDIVVLVMFGFSCLFFISGNYFEAIWSLLSICVTILIRIVNVLEGKR